jgi:hypothetical protein
MLEDFKIKIFSLEKEIVEHYNQKNENNRKLINDGIVSLEEYYYSTIKIMWILKEPRDGKNSSGGGWSLVENLRNERSKGKKKDSSQTFLPIIYTSYALLNKVKNYNELDKKKAYSEYCKSLKNIAYINIQKLPAKSNSNNKEIETAYDIDKIIILKQISEIYPDIIICTAGTKIYKNLCEDLDSELLNKTKIFNCYHPSQRKITREIYINSILKNYYN